MTKSFHGLSVIFDYLIITFGSITEVAIDVSELLEKIGISWLYINMHAVRLIDKKLIKNCVYSSKGIIAPQEGNIFWGMGLAVLGASERNGNFPPKI